MPTLYNQTEKSQHEWRNSRSKSPDACLVYQRYSDLKKDLPKHLSEAVDNKVQVYRKRRGQWGEWFEHWALDNGTPYIENEGWM